MRWKNIYENPDRILTLDDLSGFISTDGKTLDVSDFSITGIEEFPDGLEIIDCGRNYLKELPPLPSSLKYLSCDSNFLTTLPELPKGIVYVFATFNHLIKMPILPEGIETFVAFSSQNKITSLPELPHSLEIFEIGERHLSDEDRVYLRMRGFSLRGG